MRFFRIPGFTGIEAHRDDADRGSLRVVEGCLPFGTGGLRSGPVWSELGPIDYFGHDDRNHVSAIDDGKGNSIIFASRNCRVHDMAVISTEHTVLESIAKTYDVALVEPGMFNLQDATISNIGNRLLAIGDGSNEALYVGKGPVGVDDPGVFPDEQLYSQEWSRFPKCQYYVRGPKATLFAAGNPDKPLTVYISEPAGLTAPYKDSPYATESTSDIYNSGKLSTVEILGSGASQITALSTRGDQVVVHTDKGAYLLYAPAADQASTGYRVEQAPATNFSSAVSHKVVSGESGDQTFWLGHDGQVYKDEAASRGSADLKSSADEDQANWKSKGVWEFELPTDLSDSFSVFSGQTGNYLFFVKAEEAENYNFQDADIAPVVNFGYSEDVSFCYSCEPPDCPPPEAEGGGVNVCQKQIGRVDPDLGRYETCAECVENSDCADCGCGDAFVGEFGEDRPNTIDEFLSVGYSQEEAGSLVSSEVCCWVPVVTKFQIDGCNGCTQSETGTFDTIEACMASFMDTQACFYDYGDCGDCDITVGGTYFTEELCEAAKQEDDSCTGYTITDCGCVESADGAYASLTSCEAALATDEANKDCWGYKVDGCSCVQDSSGTYDSISSCEAHLLSLPDCAKYSESGCNCVADLAGSYDTVDECELQLTFNSACQGYKISGCACVVDESGEAPFADKMLCEAQLLLEDECDTYDLSETNMWGLPDCQCLRNPNGTGAYDNFDDCVADLNSRTECTRYTIQDCACVESPVGSYTGIEACETALALKQSCKRYNLTADCKCLEAAEGEYTYNECEAERVKCATYSIDVCDCIEDPEGPITGLEACNNTLLESPYAENCTGWSVNRSCECVYELGGSFSTKKSCEDSKELFSHCGGYQRWRFPLPDTVPGGGTVKECECVRDDFWGDFTTQGLCMDALEEYRPRDQFPHCYGCEYDGQGECCCECESGFMPESPCSPDCDRVPLMISGTNYCLKKGGKLCCCGEGLYHDTCGDICDCGQEYYEGRFNQWWEPCPGKDEEILRECDNVVIDLETGKTDCDTCPEAAWVLTMFENGGCECQNRVFEEDEFDMVYQNEEACNAARATACPMYTPDPFPQEGECNCVVTYDGDLTAEDENGVPGPGPAAFELETDCWDYLAENNPNCGWYSINTTCECFEDAAAGIYLGETNCLAGVQLDDDCRDHYLRAGDCECVSFDPGTGNTADGTPAFVGIEACNTYIDTSQGECARYNINENCQCEVTSGGEYLGITECEAALAVDNSCKPYWLVADEFGEACRVCTDVDPGDGSLKYDNLTLCDEALTQALNGNPPAGCCSSTANEYMADTIDGVTECMYVGPGSGTLSQCDCVNNGWPIIG